jgi:hypothetical protein
MRPLATTRCGYRHDEEIAGRFPQEAREIVGGAGDADTQEIQFRVAFSESCLDFLPRERRVEARVEQIGKSDRIVLGRKTLACTEPLWHNNTRGNGEKTHDYKDDRDGQATHHGKASERHDEDPVE